MLSAENHQWFHKQNSNVQGYMNAIFQEYKRQVDECRVVFVDELEVPFEINAGVMSVDEKGKVKFNRAEVKRETQKIIDEYLDEYEK